MILAGKDFFINCYLSLLEYGNNPHVENRHIVFTYHGLQITISKTDDKRWNYMFAIYHVTDTKRKNKAVVQRFINESYCSDAARMRIERDESVTIYLITQTFSDLAELNLHLF